MENLYISVDLGGTSLRIALLNAKGELLKLKTLSSDEVRLPKNLITHLIQECKLMDSIAKGLGGQIVGVALGIPGLVNNQTGVVYQSPHFPEWKKVELIKPLVAELPFPIFMDNDANQAALGESWLGAGRDWPSFIMLTLGTGVGGGIILDHRIFHGPNGFAGEVGHIIIDRHGLAGALGSCGTLETLVSQSGLRVQLESILVNRPHSLPAEILKLDPNSPQLPENLSQLGRTGNPFALQIWKDFGEALAFGIVSLSHAFGFLNFVIGGGIAGAWDLFYDACREEISKRMYTSLAPQVRMIPAKLGNNAGLIGGVRIIQQNHPRSI